MGRPLKDPKKSIPKHTKALVWRHFSDNEDGETVRCLLCSPKIVNMMIKNASTKSPRAPRLLPQEGVEGGGEGGEGETGREREANKFAEKTSQPKINEAINKILNVIFRE